MDETINGLKINYTDLGQSKKQAVVVLHGWGQSKEMMSSVANSLTKTNRVINIDLPGHGASDEPKEEYYLLDFVEIINKLLKKLKVKDPVIIGHSFGGKIAMYYATLYQTKKLTILAGPYKKEIKKLSFKTKVLKFLVKIPLLNKLEDFAKKHIGSTDYKNASPVMRKSMVNHVNEDLTDEVKKIKCPTLLIWGTNDEAVDISHAYELEELISDSAVIEFPGTHYAYLENLEATNNIIKEFIK